MSRNIQDFYVQAGETWHMVVRWGTDELTTVPVTGITQAAPAVVTAPNHGVPYGWPVALNGVQGMTQINARSYPPRGEEWKKSLYVDGNTVALTDVSSADYSAYLSGGFLVYSTPANLTGQQFTLNVYDTPEMNDTPLVTLTNPSGITVDLNAMTIVPLLQTAGVTWQQGYYALMNTDPTSGIVTEILRGVITIQ
jgi:hypothetical protein